MKLSRQLALIVDELLDAHDDTLRLAEDMWLDYRWEAHLSYLRDLRRVSREALAAAATDGSAEPAGSLQKPSARSRSCHAARRAGLATRVQSRFTRRGDRRCARNGHGEGPA